MPDFSYNSNHHLNKANFGFTLIEILVVLAIIALLAIFTIPAYQQYVINGQTKKCTSVRTELEQEFLILSEDAAKDNETLDLSLILALPSAAGTLPASLADLELVRTMRELYDTRPDGCEYIVKDEHLACTNPDHSDVLISTSSTEEAAPPVTRRPNPTATPAP